MVQVWLARKIAFELHPIKLLYLLLLVGINEAVQLAIGNAIEDPAVAPTYRADFGSFDPYRWIVLRDDDIVFDFSFRAFGLGGDAGDEQGRDRDSSKRHSRTVS